MEQVSLANYSCWVHGEERRTEEWYPLIDPCTGKVFAQSVAADANLVDFALKSAERCFKDWRSSHANHRVKVLHDLASRVRDEIESLASLLSREVGKPLQAARDEVLSASSLFDYFAEEALRLRGEISPQGNRCEQAMILREPVGVVGAITPFNYPLSTLACKAAPALAAGCAVVAKPDEHTPASSLQLARLAHEAGLPAGALNVVTGTGPGAGSFIVEHPIPRIITFTGSSKVGKEILTTCAKSVRKAILELGGNCPAIVCADAPLREVLPQIMSQGFKNSGQYCYRITRVYVDEHIYQSFVERLIKLVSGLRVGHTLDSSVHLGPLNNSEVLTRVRRQVETAVREGARVVFSGSVPENTGGFYYPPTILADLPREASILHEEVFGPVLIVNRYTNIDDAIEEANATPYGLAAYLFTADLGKALRWSGRIEAGSIWVNRVHQAYMDVPFGGMKESGLGREKSRFGLEEFTELKAVYLSY